MALVDQSCLARLGCLSWVVLNEHQLVLVLGPHAGLIEGQIRMLAGQSVRSVSNRLRLPLASTSDQAKGRRSATKSIRLRRAGARCSRLG
jgi:tRNA A37 threonylcarbamoyladenosine synthetase subunit TsaC/SUA5/YrdC